MTDTSKSNANSQTADEITDTGSPSSRTVTPMRVILGAAVITALGATAFMTLGRPTIGNDIVLNDAFVRGAVSQIGTDENARILDLHVALGDAVQKGDPLIDLSSERLEARRAALVARISEIEADLRAARARDNMATRRDGMDVTAARLERNATKARLDRARAQVTLLEERVGRREELADSGVTSEARLSEESTELEKGQAEVARLTARLASAELSIDRARVDADADVARQAERDAIAARLARAQAELAELDLRIDRRTLVALDEGVVVDVPARPGASVGTDDPILSIWDPAQTWMLAWVDQDRMGRIRVGDPATIRIDSVAEPVEGKVHRILIAANGEERSLPGQPVSPLLPDNSRFAVQVRFDARGMEDRILPGMSGSVSIAPSGKTDDPTPMTDLRDMLASYFPL